MKQAVRQETREGRRSNKTSSSGGENNGFGGAEGENTMMKTETSGARFKRGGPGGGEGGQTAQLFKSEILSLDPQNLVTTWWAWGPTCSSSWEGSQEPCNKQAAETCSVGEIS